MTSSSSQFSIQIARSLQFLGLVACFAVVVPASATSVDQYLPELTELRCRYVEWDPNPVNGSLDFTRDTGLRAVMEMKIGENRQVRLGAVNIEIKDRRLSMKTVQTDAGYGLGVPDSTRSAVIGRRSFLTPDQSGPNALNKDNVPYKVGELSELSMSAYSVVTSKSEPAEGGGTKFTAINRMFRISCQLN